MIRLVVLVLLILAIIFELAVINSPRCYTFFLLSDTAPEKAACQGAANAIVVAIVGVITVLVSYVISYNKKLAAKKSGKK